MPLFDAHLDLAYLAECGRDMTKGLHDCGGPHPPAAVTFPSLRDGGITACLGTIFTEPDGDDAVAYPSGDAERANVVGLRQLDRYHAWAGAGLIRLMGRKAPRHDDGKARRHEGTQARRHEGASASGPGAPLLLGILVEGADPIGSPDDLSWWVQRGVIAIGLTWARSSRYAGGNSTDDGLTDLGRAMIPAMDALGVVHDLSHLSDRAMDELLTLTDKPVIASHSNCRALLDGKNQRHLRDDSIREVARRGGVIGLNLVRNFIRTGLDPKDPNDRPSIEEAARHVEYTCELLGHSRAVGLGTDLDGGISAHDLPAGINAPKDLAKILGTLRARGWGDEAIEAFARANWARFFGPLLDRGAAVGAPQNR